MLAKGEPYKPREIPPGIGGTSPTSGGVEVTSVGGCDAYFSFKKKKNKDSENDNRV